MKGLYPGYDVLAKRNSLSWNDLTREVIDARLAIDPDAHVFFSDAEFLTLKALAAGSSRSPRNAPNRCRSPP